MEPMNSTTTSIRKGLQSPRDGLKYLHRRARIRLQRLNRRYHERFLRPAPDSVIPDRQWDTLVVLDACRADYYRDLSELEGSAETIESNGTTTIQWLRANFDEPHHDIVYVSANPQVERLDRGLFHDVYRLYADEWEDDIGSVSPASVTEAALEAHEKYPRKRIVVHYLQPHAPYLATASVEDPFVQSPDVATLGLNTDRETLQAAYRHNLDLVLDEVTRLIPQIDGKVVITADHGELLGERMRPIPIRGYEHAAHIWHPKLVKVPWHEFPSADRRDVVSEQPVVVEEDSPSIDVQSRLASLGYV